MSLAGKKQFARTLFEIYFPILMSSQIVMSFLPILLHATENLMLKLENKITNGRQKKHDLVVFLKT